MLIIDPNILNSNQNMYMYVAMLFGNLDIEYLDRNISIQPSIRSFLSITISCCKEMIAFKPCHYMTFIIQNIYTSILPST